MKLKLQSDRHAQCLVCGEPFDVVTVANDQRVYSDTCHHDVSTIFGVSPENVTDREESDP